jgi:predicted phage terminase large subunit-like protein
MPIKPIEWDGLTPIERAAMVAAGETGPLAFTALWFNVSQVDSFRPNWHHHYYDWAARKLLSGESTAMCINLPPGGTKTEFWSIHLPAYCMVKFPRVRILNTSYSKDLATENSERTRALFRSSEFAEFYPFDFGKDKVDDWTLERDGKRLHQLFSRPSGGQITGVRGGYMGNGFSGYVMADDWDKIDDLFSDAKRKKSHMRLINTLRSRRAQSNTPFVFVQQRGHVDDSTAFLLSGGMGLRVDTHITIPALIDQDYIDSLPPDLAERCKRSICHTQQEGGYWSYWPEKESIADLMALRSAHPYTFTSQYMQSPESLDGGIFSADHFTYFGDTSEGADIPEPDQYDYRIITVDTAQKTNTWNDWTVFAEWGVTKTHIHRLGYQRARMKADQLRRDFTSFVQSSHAKNGPQWGVLRAVYVEDKSSGTGLIQEVEGKLPIRVTPLQRDKDKLTRAMDVQAHHIARKVALPYGDANNFEFVSEVASFSHDDSHKHDDQTDVMIDALFVAFVTNKNAYTLTGAL